MGERYRQPQDHRRPATPGWLKHQQAKSNALLAARQANPNSNTILIVPASQHPLEGRDDRPGPEFAARLRRSVAFYRHRLADGKPAVFFVPGSRHYDKDSGRTDRLALFDSAARFLLERDVDPAHIHGRDWIDRYRPGQGIYSGAEEVEVAAAGFKEHDDFAEAYYFCAPGQASRAIIYAAAYGMPLQIERVDASDSLGNQEVKSFHGGIKGLAMRGITRVLDPYGDGLTRTLTRNRIPADGNMGSMPDALAQPENAVLSNLSWYQATAS